MITEIWLNRFAEKTSIPRWPNLVDCMTTYPKDMLTNKYEKQNLFLYTQKFFIKNKISLKKK